MLNNCVLSLLLLCFARCSPQNLTTCECALLIDEDAVIQLDSFSVTNIESCTVDDETQCGDSCGDLGDQFDQNLNLSDIYPNDSEGHTYGQIYCTRANETLGDAYIGGIWQMNTEFLVSGEACLQPTAWEPVFLHFDVLCCDPEGIYEPNCGV